MKKIEYMAPEMEVLEMKLQGILCDSPANFNDGEGSGSGTWDPNPGAGPGE